MRLFVAVPVAEPAQGELERLLASLRRTDWPVRWVSDEVVHITLKFFGEVADERLDVIAEALSLASSGTQPLTLQLAQFGAFPTQRRPRVLLAGVDGNAGFAALRERVETSCEAIGFAPEGVPFAPHVTLGRIREGQRLPPRAFDSEAVAIAPHSFVADRIVLFESVLTPGGPRYSARNTFMLGA
jgi:RNA 2',3'-cyclic 3'-phosphodiesterase